MLTVGELPATQLLAFWFADRFASVERSIAQAILSVKKLLIEISTLRTRSPT